MSAKILCFCALTALIVATFGCQPEQTMSDPWQNGMDVSPVRWRSTFQYMADNAVIQNMALADIHFVAHSPELSQTGSELLERMVPFVDTYGGTIRYETDLSDEMLVSERLDRIETYLRLAECNMAKVEIVSAMSGGRTITADEAIKILQEGTVRNGTSGGGFGGASGGGPFSTGG